MARKRVALIIPLNDRNTGAYQRNLSLARQWRNVLLLSGVDASIIAAGDVSKAQFQSQYDFGIVPFMETITYPVPINSWLHYSPGDKPLYLCGYHTPQGASGTPLTGVLGLTPISNGATDIRRVGRRAVWSGGNPPVYVAPFTARINNIYQGLRVDPSNPTCRCCSDQTLTCTQTTRMFLSRAGITAISCRQ
jgi:hypothetical protein